MREIGGKKPRRLYSMRTMAGLAGRIDSTRRPVKREGHRIVSGHAYVPSLLKTRGFPSWRTVLYCIYHGRALWTTATIVVADTRELARFDERAE